MVTTVTVHCTSIELD